MRVLVVDDDPFILEFCRLALEAAGHSVCAVDSGATAASLHEMHRFDVALVDLFMPGMGGLEVLKSIRQNDPDATVVLITANADKDSILQALRLGAKELIEKPLTADRLVSVVNRVSRQSPGRTLRGDLRSMNLTTLLQACCGDRREGRLRFFNRDEDALLYLSEGAIVHAELEEVQGEEAFFRLLRWTEGEFEFDSGIRAPERSISRNLEGLLLEGLGRMDEEGGEPIAEHWPESASPDWESMAGNSLDVLAEKAEGFLACALVGRGGTLLATRFASSSFEAAGFGVVVAALAEVARKAMAQTGEGQFQECVVESEARLLVLHALGEQALVVLADPAHAGHTRLVAREVSARLAAELVRVWAPES